MNSQATIWERRRNAAVGAPLEITSLQGQVTSLQNQLTATIAGTANNIPGVATLGIAVSNPPQQFEVQPIADKVDELINTLRRL